MNINFILGDGTLICECELPTIPIVSTKIFIDDKAYVVSCEARIYIAKTGFNESFVKYVNVILHEVAP